MSKNGIATRAIGSVIAAIIIAIIFFVASSGIGVQSNRKEIKRVDMTMQTLIIEQKDFQEKTTKSLHAIDKDVTYIRAKLEGD